MSAALIIHAPQPFPSPKGLLTVFLAGSIEMGKAEDWQSKVTAALDDIECLILNPRRPDWDASWVQEKTNPQFRQQVEWELDGMDRADVIAFYLAPGTVSPISLLELGLHVARSCAKLIICCPHGFERKGNVDIVAERHGLYVYSHFHNFVEALRENLL